MQIDSILTDIRNQVKDNIAVLGSSLSVDIIQLYKFTQGYTDNAELVFVWNKKESRSVNHEKSSISFDDNHKIFLDKIRKRIPLRGSSQEYMNTLSFMGIPSYKSFIIIAIEIDGRLWGFIACIDLKKEHEWSLDDLSIIMEVSQKATQMIHNGYLFEDLARKEAVCSVYLEDVEDITLQMNDELIIKSCSGYLVRSGVIKRTDIEGKHLPEFLLFKNDVEKEQIREELEIIKTRRHSFNATVKIATYEKWMHLQSNTIEGTDNIEIFCAITDIDKIKHIDDKNEIYESILGNSGTIYIIWDHNIKPVFISKSVDKLTDNSHEDILSILHDSTFDSSSFMPLNDINQLQQLVSRTFQEMHESRFNKMEIMIVNKSGGNEYYTASAYRIKDDKRKFSGVITELNCTTDIESISMLDRLLKKNLGKKALDPAYVYMIKRDGTITYANRNLISLSETNIVNNKIIDYLDEDQIGNYFKEILATNSQNITTKIVYSFMKFGSEKLYMATIATPLYEAGIHDGYICVARKVMSSLQMEVTDEQKKTMQEMTSELVWITDMNLKYTYISHSFDNLLGHSVESIFHLKDGSLYTQETQRRLAAIFKSGFNSVKKRNSDWQRNIILNYIDKKGNVLRGRSKIRIYTDVQKNPKGFICLSIV